MKSSMHDSGGIKLLVLCCALLFASGCALHYYDKSTGTEHLWGFGHLKMRAVPQRDDQPPFTNAVMAFVTGIRTFGLHLGGGEDFGGLVVGWDSRSRMVISSENSHFYLLWPTNTIWLPWDLRDRLFTVRVGTNSPFINGELITHSKVNQPSP